MDWSIVTGTAGSITGIAALVISASSAARAARAERPVEWLLRLEALGEHGATTLKLSCAGADALSVVVEGHYQLDDGLPAFWIQRQGALLIGEDMDIVFPPGSLDGGWLVVSWCHPRDRTRPIRAWFPVEERGTAHDEYVRQTTANPLVLWLRARLLLSPVRPGGIPGRRTGWRDRRIVRRELLSRGVKRWQPRLPRQGGRPSPVRTSPPD